jgi:acetyl-CoA carboxylase biotin carboxylase subunit
VGFGVRYLQGNKPAKQIANIQVPLLQGSQGNVKNTAEAADIASKIGYPVILKAAAGGGGRGMRIIEKASNLEKMFKMATNEAEKAFGDPSVFIEKYVRNPRHIEFQILGDVMALPSPGEREFQSAEAQKLIESPSIALDDLRQMGCRYQHCQGYYYSQEVEFLLDTDKIFMK